MILGLTGMALGPLIGRVAAAIFGRLIGRAGALFAEQLLGRLASATGRDIVEIIARQQAGKGVGYLLGFLSRAEQKAYLATRPAVRGSWARLFTGRLLASSNVNTPGVSLTISRARTSLTGRLVM
jgi:hypothetical protein